MRLKAVEISKAVFLSFTLYNRIVAFPFFLKVGVTCSLPEKGEQSLKCSFSVPFFVSNLLPFSFFLFSFWHCFNISSVVSGSAPCNHEATISGWNLQLQMAVVFFFFPFFHCLLFFVSEAWQQSTSALIVIRGLKGNNVHNYAKGSVFLFDYECQPFFA